MSENVWLALIAAVVSIAPNLIGLVIIYMKMKQAALDAAKKVEEVKNTLEVTEEKKSEEMKELKRVADATHTLVNSGESTRLRLLAVALRRVADLTTDMPGSEEDRKAAEIAEQAYQSHEAKQRIVDSESGSVRTT